MRTVNSTSSRLLWPYHPPPKGLLRSSFSFFTLADITSREHNYINTRRLPLFEQWWSDKRERTHNRRLASRGETNNNRTRSRNEWRPSTIIVYRVTNDGIVGVQSRAEHADGWQQTRIARAPRTIGILRGGRPIDASRGEEGGSEAFRFVLQSVWPLTSLWDLSQCRVDLENVGGGVVYNVFENVLRRIGDIPLPAVVY